MTAPKFPVIKGFFIYDPTTNLYSRGGSSSYSNYKYGPKWSKTPKIWASIGHLKNHLNMALVRTNHSRDEVKPHFFVYNHYKNATVFDVVTQAPAVFDINSYIMEYINSQKNSSKYYADYDVVFEP